jgi:hypothetical protein
MSTLRSFPLSLGPCDLQYLTMRCAMTLSGTCIMAQQSLVRLSTQYTPLSSAVAGSHRRLFFSHSPHTFLSSLTPARVRVYIYIYKYIYNIHMPLYLVHSFVLCCLQGHTKIVFLLQLTLPLELIYALTEM